MHFDHIGDPSEFPNSEVVVGPGARDLSLPGYPSLPDSPFLETIFQHPKVRELSYEQDQWTPFGPFPKAFNFFGDGSFYLLDAPGHMAGHMMALARSAANEFIVMGGDCCHHKTFVTGEAVMGTGFGPNGAPRYEKLGHA